MSNDESGRNLNSNLPSIFRISDIMISQFPKNYVEEFNIKLKQFRLKLNQQPHQNKELFEQRNRQLLRLKDYFVVQTVEDFFKKYQKLKKQSQTIAITQKWSCNCCYEKWQESQLFACIVCLLCPLCPLFVIVFTCKQVCKDCKKRQYRTIAAEIKDLYEEYWRKLLLEQEQEKNKKSSTQEQQKQKKDQVDQVD